MMTPPADPLAARCTAFAGYRRIAQGPLGEVALAIKAYVGDEAILAFDDTTGRVLDLDLRGTDAEILRGLGPVADRQSTADEPASNQATEPAVRPRGRPKLGVVAREVTLLPRHWEWLAAQPGGASQVLRRLIDEARRRDSGQTHSKAVQERAYRFLAALAGDLPGYEEVIRALFAHDPENFAARMAEWPAAVSEHALQLAGIN